MKRLVDIGVAAGGLAVLWPLLLLIAVAIRLGGSGPVIFTQERIGRGFRPFRIYKFRTMVVDAERRGPAVAVHNDRRVTGVGRLLRRTKLDELPQLVNVLKGDMSLVGPRPELPRYVRQFHDDFHRILSVRPGITDLASIAYRQEAALLAGDPDPESRYVKSILPDKIRLATTYVEHASLAYDLRLVLETLLVLTYPAAWLDWLFERLGRHHVTATLPIQAAAVALANLAALSIRFDGVPPPETLATALRVLPILVLIRCVCLQLFNLYGDLWLYVGIPELGSIVLSTALGSAVFWALLQWPAAFPAYPTSLVTLDGLLCIIALSALRVARRVHRSLRCRVQHPRRVLVVGVDDSAERTLRELAVHPRFDYRIVGMVGENRASYGLRIHNVPVVGCCDELPEILRAENPDEVFVIASAVAGPRRVQAVRACRALGRPVRVVPDLDELLTGRPQVVQLESGAVDELLFRDPIPVDLEGIRAIFEGRRVLVTGAGGSIGSEICRQIAACAPARLVLFEKHEASLFHVERALRARHPDLALGAVIGDVRDMARVNEVFTNDRPEVVFHAAAYKHVPMMESNPWEAVKTNVLGTRIVARAAELAGVHTFVLISTDKAVEPVSVMGTSKRMAEVLIQTLACRARTRFLTVRFGNVLESSGSVVPLFREQIERGGPVTVTHADVTRWFMTVPEAVQLILTTATMGRGGEVFVLDMGKPVRILDLARALIQQYGLRPEADIPIVFTGLRPGERLFEKLFNDHEQVWKTTHSRIFMAVDSNGNGNGNGRVWRSEEFRRLLSLVRDKAGMGRVAVPSRVLSEVDESCV